jgi:hypothetical protein
MASLARRFSEDPGTPAAPNRNLLIRIPPELLTTDKALPAKTPAKIRELLRQCLEKDAGRRLPTAGLVPGDPIELNTARTMKYSEQSLATFRPRIFRSFAHIVHTNSRNLRDFEAFLIRSALIEVQWRFRHARQTPVSSALCAEASNPCYTETLSLIASFGAFTKSCFVPKYRSVV